MSNIRSYGVEGSFAATCSRAIYSFKSLEPRPCFLCSLATQIECMQILEDPGTCVDMDSCVKVVAGESVEQT